MKDLSFAGPRVVSKSVNNSVVYILLLFPTASGT
jgi:hypothetical protein